MASRIEQLPVELQTHILSCLRHADLAILMRVSRSLQRLATPWLWTHIELHRPGWHEHFQYEDTLNIDDITRNNEHRNYIEFPSEKSVCDILDDYCSPGDPYRYYYYRADRYLRFLSPFAAPFYAPPFGHDIPYKHVKSLCLDIDFDHHSWRDECVTQDIWAVFSAFQKLESLELIVDWPYEPEDWYIREQRFYDRETSLPPLTKLRKLCLRGYIPRNFARWILTHPDQLAFLELSILDRPIGSSELYSTPKNPPPVRKRDQNPLEDLEDDGGEIPWVTEEADSDSESEEDLHDELVGPRALTICEGTDIPDKLQSLSTLILTRPIRSSDDEDQQELKDLICCSIRSDKAILREWIRLIRATRRTLEHLVLDQRPYCEEIELESTGPDEYLELYPYGSCFQRFKDMVLPVLLEDAEWPMLKSIQFYGFDVPEPLTTKRIHPGVYRPWPSQQSKAQHTFLPQMKQRFEPKGVDVGSALGQRMVFRGDDGVVSSGDGLGGQIDEDED